MTKLPPLKDYQSAQEFFRDFYQLNQPHLSHRRFAVEIDWPVSLLGDMIQGRKPLTVNRAVEFAKHFDLNSVYCEHLIMLSLRCVDNEDVRAFAGDYLKTEGAKMRMDGNQQTHHLVSAELYSHAECMILHAYLTWSKGALDFDKLAGHLPAFPRFKDREFVEGLLKKMTDDGIIEKNENKSIEAAAPRFNILKENLVAPGLKAQPQIAHLKLFKQICEATPSKVDWSAGTVIFPKNRIKELNDKRTALRTWILMTADRTGPNGANPEDDHTILQIDLSTFELLDADRSTTTRPKARA
jgi:hypothetical protein